MIALVLPFLILLASLGTLGVTLLVIATWPLIALVSFTLVIAGFVIGRWYESARDAAWPLGPKRRAPVAHARRRRETLADLTLADSSRVIPIERYRGRGRR